MLDIHKQYVFDEQGEAFSAERNCKATAVQIPKWQWIAP